MTVFLRDRKNSLWRLYEEERSHMNIFSVIAPILLYRCTSVRMSDIWICQEYYFLYGIVVVV